MKKQLRITPGPIEDLKDNQVFVFGSNLAGIHGAGAAKVAYQKFGARFGHGHGLLGKSYALPTKDKGLKVLPLYEIDMYVEIFLKLTQERPNTQFFVTQVGCGLAGYKPTDIAPMFKEAVSMPNIWLPRIFQYLLMPEFNPDNRL